MLGNLNVDLKKVAADLHKPKTYGHFIDGTWVGGNTGATIELTNPATREVLGHIQAGDAIDVDRAVNAAHRPLPGGRRARLPCVRTCFTRSPHNCARGTSSTR